MPEHAREIPDKGATREWKPQLVADDTRVEPTPVVSEGETALEVDVEAQNEKLGLIVEGHSIGSAKHESNEDAHHVGVGRVCVADGMGSHGGGDIASFLTTESFRVEMDDRGITSNSSQDEVREALEAAMEGANEAIDDNRINATVEIEKRIAAEADKAKRLYARLEAVSNEIANQGRAMESAPGTDDESKNRLAALKSAWDEKRREMTQVINDFHAKAKEIRQQDAMREMKTTAIMTQEYKGPNGEKRIMGSYIGDSRAFLVRDGKITELTTKKDTLVSYLNNEIIAGLNAGRAEGEKVPRVNEDDPASELPPELVQWVKDGLPKSKTLQAMFAGGLPKTVGDLSSGATAALTGGTAEKDESGGPEYTSYGVEAHHFDEEVREGDTFLFCSDGLDNLSPAEILQLTQQTSNVESLPQVLAEAAKKASQDENNPRAQDDDITVVTLHSMPELEVAVDDGKNRRQAA